MPFLMAQTKMDWPMSFTLSAENSAEGKEQSQLGSALSSASCQRFGRHLNGKPIQTPDE
jgi:hypothetical protein